MALPLIAGGAGAPPRGTALPTEREPSEAAPLEERGDVGDTFQRGETEVVRHRQRSGGDETGVVNTVRMKKREEAWDDGS